jgi:tetrahydromethanopterin S-methyltransferase subunit G
MTPPPLSRFDEYKLLIMDKLDVLDKRLERLDEKLDKARHEITALKVRSSMWGAAAGALISIVVSVIAALLTRLLK